MADNNPTTVVIELTAKVTMRVPFNEDHYPGQTIDEAVEWEQNQDKPEMAEALVNHLSLPEEEGGVSLTWTVRIEEVPVSDD